MTKTKLIKFDNGKLPSKYICGYYIGTYWLVLLSHYGDVIMGTMASQITSLTIVYSIVHSGADQRKHQSSASLAFVRGIHRGPVNSPYKWPVTQKMLHLDDVIMVKSMLNYVLVTKDFLTWLLVGWRLGSQPIRCQVWKYLLTNMDFNMVFS